MLVSDVLRRNARRTPDRNALLMVDGSGARTYAELYERATRLANALLGVAAPGDRVAILSENSPEYVEAYYGVPSAGMALTMLNYRLHPKEWVWILNDSGARVLLVARPYLEAIADHLGEIDALEHVIVIGDPAPGFRTYDDLVGAASAAVPEVPVGADDVAWLLYTSGTTGFPKGAQLTHRNLTTAMIQSVLEYDPTPRTRFLNAMPLCHVAGYLTPTHQFYGGSVLMMSGWDPELWMRLVQEHRVTSGGFAPTMMSMLLAHPKIWDYDLGSLEWMGYGASKIPADVLRRTIERFGSVVYAGMGMTELGGNILTLDKEAHIRAANGEEHLLDAVGKPMSLVDVRVVNSAGEDCADGEVGEIVVQGDQVTVGYFGNPEATEQAFAGGWFHTGDLARRDGEGFLYIVDRAKDMIISGGENVYSSEVENAVYEHPGVAEAAVIGLPDPVWGEKVAVVVVRREGHEVSADDVVGQCTSRLASYKRPREVIFVDSLPKTVSGKIRKNDLRERYGTAK
ncbi:long-chain fatty acid--CoA ligase [Microtetraspora sp. AC03309]|uniref:class I adenylate-forming enzyme family protein n=1 Tax=Microtetraspora sp. AC03309 TaxID=2779376 RepID=UPI001E4C4CB7|nr:long-chain fatty acid--CoA ligase [Microtetraspora sp. AC03309]MCC5578128.1 long-chain fatty acid--CoA ligase [Microtetraspora sp. AC03309]